MSGGAIITLQLGHYSNHVGAHFWNIQEDSFVFPSSGDARDSQPDVNHDVLFREGVTINREVTFTPRLVSVDLKGCLGRLPELGDLYDRPHVPKIDSIFWQGETEVRKEEPRRKNDFQKELEAAENMQEDEDKDLCDDTDANKPSTVKLYDLDGQVDVWSDFLRARFHPKSNVVVHEYQHKNTLLPFDVFGLGRSAWKEGVGEDVEDRVRFFAEEADGLQGFQIVSDTFSAFGGLTASLLDLLGDEYSSKGVISFPTAPCAYEEYSAQANSARFMNSVLSVQAQIAASTMISPLSLGADTFVLPGQHRTLPHVSYNPVLPYHSSAILAGALNTMTLPWRARANPAQMDDLALGLTPRGRKVVSSSVAMPFSMGDDQFFVERLHDDGEDGSLVSLTPACQFAKTDVSVQAASLCGVGRDRFRPADFKTGEKHSEHPYRRCESMKEALQLHLDLNFRSTVNGVYLSEDACPVGRPFPRFFKESVDRQGFLTKIPRNVKEEDVKSVPVMTCWQNSKGTAGYVDSLHARARKINLNRFHRFKEAGLEEDEFGEVLEGLSTLADNYTETDCF